MTGLTELRDRMKEVYAGYSFAILPAGRFLLALAVFLYINRTLGNLEVLNNLYLVLILSLLCALLPTSVTVSFAMLLILGHCWGISPIVAAVALGVLLLLWLLFLRFTPEDGLAMCLTPLAFGLHIPAAVPIGFGLAKGPSSAIAVACGVVLQYFLQALSGDIAELAAQKDISKVDLGVGCLQALVKNEEMLLSVVVCALVVLIVYSVRKLSADYAWQASVAAGGIAYVVLMLLGAYFLESSADMLPLLLGTAASCLIGMLLQFFLFGADYRRSEFLQFSDDEYYYYVKAVPLGAARIREEDPADRDVWEEPVRERTKTALRGGLSFDTREFPGAEELRRQMPDRGPGEDMPPAEQPDSRFEDVDFEARLEDTLKNL